MCKQKQIHVLYNHFYRKESVHLSNFVTERSVSNVYVILDAYLFNCFSKFSYMMEWDITNKFDHIQ